MNIGKRTLLAIGLAALAPLAATSVQAATLTDPSAVSTGMASAFDRAIDLYVQQRVASGQLRAADATVAREQLQMRFLSLGPAEQRRIVDASRSLGSEEAVQVVMKMLGQAVEADARQALADVQSKATSGQQQAIRPKLGVGGADLVFVATAGPCRVFDSRNGPGPLAGGDSRQIWGFSWFSGYSWAGDQGGTGTAGAGNCAGSVFPTVYPTSVVATVTVVNTASTGALRAWNGGTTLTVGAILAWNPGDRMSNTTAIAMDRTIAAYPGSGSKRDFGVNNNSPTPIDIIVDVVGYFIENQATPLDCTTVSGPGYTLGAFTSTLYTAPSCPSGYTAIVAQPVTNVYGVNAGTLFENACRISNTTGGAVNVNCGAMCCRIPGR